MFLERARARARARVFWCLCVVTCFMWHSAPAPRPPLSLLPLSVLVCAHGGFQGLVAERPDATSALDPGPGSSLFIGTADVFLWCCFLVGALSLSLSSSSLLLLACLLACLPAGIDINGFVAGIVLILSEFGLFAFELLVQVAVISFGQNPFDIRGWRGAFFL